MVTEDEAYAGGYEAALLRVAMIFGLSLDDKDKFWTELKDFESATRADERERLLVMFEDGDE